jgi:hypothetical protein
MATLMNIQDVALGTFVQVTFPFFARHRDTLIDIDGLFIRRTDDGTRKPLVVRKITKILSLVGRSFFGRVIANNSVTRQLTVNVRDKPSNGRIYYEIIIPYNEMIRLARLIPNDRDLIEMTIEEEDAYRNKNRRSSVSGQYFHPRDRFVPVRII